MISKSVGSFLTSFLILGLFSATSAETRIYEDKPSITVLSCHRPVGALLSEVALLLGPSLFTDQRVLWFCASAECMKPVLF
jgi:hypothetical protein